MMDKKSIALMTSILAFAAIASANADPLPNVQLKGSLQTFATGDFESVYGLTADSRSGGKLAGTITKVRLGSLAARSGLRAGDKILSAKATATTLDVIIERDGKRYGANLRAETGGLDSGINGAGLRSGATGNQLTGGVAGNQLRGGVTGTDLRGGVPGNALGMTPQTPKPDTLRIPVGTSEDDPEKKIRPYEVVVIIDRTGSMTEPVAAGTAMSKWQWACKQIMGLMEEKHGRIEKVTVVPFNETYQVNRYANLEAVEGVYRSTIPEGFTCTYAPLKDRIDNYFYEKRHGLNPRPLLIAVLTDGEPNRPGGPAKAEQLVRQTLIETTREMTDPTEIVVTFLEIGSRSSATAFLKELDDDLTSEGAKYDIVDTKTFGELSQIGLRKALVAALEENHGKVRAAIMQAQAATNRALSPQSSQRFASEKAEIQREAQANIDSIDRTLADEIGRVRSAADEEISTIPQGNLVRIGSRTIRGQDPDYPAKVERIKADAASKISRLKEDAEQRKQAIRADADRRCAGFDSTAGGK